MTKQFIVVQLVAAKLAALGFLPLDRDLVDYGRIADKIIEMFPEPSVEIKYKGMIDYKQVRADTLRANIELMEDE